MGNFNDRIPDETYWNPNDMRLYDIMNRELRQPVAGDMIQFHRIDYEHWAVYVGHDKVIQVTVEGSDNKFRNKCFSSLLFVSTLGKHTARATVTKEDFKHVIGSDGVARINNFKDRQWEVLPADEIIRRAESALGRSGYHVLSNNCEHFATECRYGKRLSGQEEAFWSTVTFGLYKRK